MKVEKIPSFKVTKIIVKNSNIKFHFKISQSVKFKVPSPLSTIIKSPLFVFLLVEDNKYNNRKLKCHRLAKVITQLIHSLKLFSLTSS